MKKDFNVIRCFKGSGILVITMIAAVMVGIIALSITKISHSVFSGANSSRITIQAQEYALTRAEALRVKAYGDLAAINKRQIANTDNYFEEVILDAENVYPSDNTLNQRVCTVNIYKDSEPFPRHSLKVVRVSGSGQSSLPVGSIIPWYGQIADIPNGFALCNGSNGTPDLRNRFIVGAGSTYALGAGGGEDKVTLTNTQVGSHYHATGYHNNNNTGRWLSTAGTTKNYSLADGTTGAFWNGSGGGGYSGQSTGSLNLITSLAVSTAASSAHENRPPYYALYYIMKI